MQFFIEFKIAFKIFNQRKKKLYNFHFDPVSPSLPQRIFLEMQKKTLRGSAVLLSHFIPLFHNVTPVAHGF